MGSLPFIPSTENPESIEDTYTPALDLNNLLVIHPAATFFMRAASPKPGISTGDILVVDRSLTPKRGQRVVAVNDGHEFTTEIFGRQSEVWGVVTYVIHNCRDGN